MIGIVISLILAITPVLYAKTLNVDIKVYQPRGISISVPDSPGIESVYFWASVNEEFSSGNKRNIKLGVIQPIDGKWIIHDEDLQFKGGDVINYVLFIKRRSVFERYDQRKYVVPGVREENSVLRSTTSATPTPSTYSGNTTTQFGTTSTTTVGPFGSSSSTTKTDLSESTRNGTTPTHSEVSATEATSGILNHTTSDAILTSSGIVYNATTESASAYNRSYSTTPVPGDMAHNHTPPSVSTALSSSENIFNATTEPSAKYNSSYTTEIMTNNHTSSLTEVVNEITQNATTPIPKLDHNLANTSSNGSLTNSNNLTSIVQPEVRPESPFSSTTEYSVENKILSTSNTSLSIFINVTSSNIEASNNTTGIVSATSEIVVGSSTTPTVLSSVTSGATSGISSNSISFETQAKPSTTSSNPLHTIDKVSTTSPAEIPDEIPSSTTLNEKPQLATGGDCRHRIILQTEDFTFDFYGNANLDKIDPNLLTRLVVNDCNVEYKTAEEEPNVVDIFIS